MDVETLVLGLDHDDEAVLAYYDDAETQGQVPMQLSLSGCGYYQIGADVFAVLRNNYHVLAIYQEYAGGPLERLDATAWPAALTDEDA